MAAMEEQTINSPVGKTNPDLQKERDCASFQPNQLTALLYGGTEGAKKRRNLIRTLFNDPAFNQEVKYLQSKPERYENSVMQSVRLVECIVKNGWDDECIRLASSALHYDMVFTVHAAMFTPSIARLGTPEQQAEWLPKAYSFQIIGTYAQTELGHGTNLKALQTTATYDKSSDSFIMNTPFPSGMKWWPGGLGKTTTHALVSAQLIVEGENCGFQLFIVQLRDTTTHEQLPGIEVGDIGPRISVGITDNGYLILHDVKIPRDQMLSKYCQVTPEGKFVRRAGSEKAGYGAMMLIRAHIVNLCYENASQAVTIATRYAAVRRQSELKPGAPEPQILDYVTQQYKLLPNIALSYALFFTQRYMIDYHDRVVQEEVSKDNFSGLPELHGQSCGLKAYCSDLTMDAVEVCRRSCGGHGFLMASGLCSLLMDGLGSVTYEGENTVMYLQTAKFLMKNFAVAKQGGTPACALSFLTSLPSSCGIRSSDDCCNLPMLKQAFLCRAYFMTQMAATKLNSLVQSGQAEYEAWNNCSVDLVRTTKAYLDSFVAVNFIECLSSLDLKPEVKSILNKLCCLHALHRIVESSGEFLQSRAVDAQQLEMIKSAELKVLSMIRPDAVALVDAFDWHDQTLNSALGRYDGNVYEKMYELAKKGPLNNQSVLPAIHKYIKPLQAKAKL